MISLRCKYCGYLLIADITKNVTGKAELKCPICRKTGLYADIATIRETTRKSDVEVTVKVNNRKKNNLFPF